MSDTSQQSCKKGRLGMPDFSKVQALTLHSLKIEKKSQKG